MKKRTLLIALLVVPIGIAIAQEKARLGNQSAVIKQGDMAQPAYINKYQSGVITQGDMTQPVYTDEARLGSQSAVIKQGDMAQPAYIK